MKNLNRRIAVSGIAASFVSPSFASDGWMIPVYRPEYALRMASNAVLHLTNRQAADLVLRALETGLSQAEPMLERLSTKFLLSGSNPSRTWRRFMRQFNVESTILGAITNKLHKTQTYSEFANDAVLLIKTFIDLYAESVMQLFLRKKFGMPEAIAKWAAEGILHIELGSWKRYIRPYIVKELILAHYSERDGLRKLLVDEKPISFAQFFYDLVGRGDNAPELGVNGSYGFWTVWGRSQTEWGTLYAFTLNLSSQGYTLCTKYKNQPSEICMSAP